MIRDVGDQAESFAMKSSLKQLTRFSDVTTKRTITWHGLLFAQRIY